MRDWSTYFQNGDFLEKSRMLIMNRDMAARVAEWIGITDDAQILDVGCGSGELTFYLANVGKGGRYTGVDMDRQLLARAQERAANDHNGSLEFVQADALNLPFADDTFDIVVSQTFFTSVADYEKAMEEMRRVCRTGGRIVSLTPLSFSNAVINYNGSYPADAQWVEAYRSGLVQLDALYHATGSMSRYVTGIVPTQMPEFFARAGLERICAYPVGNFLSLSNHTMSHEDKRRYIELDYQSELERFRANLALPAAAGVMGAAEAAAWEAVLRERRDDLLSRLDDNAIWEWLGSTFLLVVGENPAALPDTALETEQEALRRQTAVYRQYLEKRNLECEEHWHHSGIGRAASMTIGIAGTDFTAKGVGITPAHAAHDGYQRLIALLLTGMYSRYTAAEEYLAMPDTMYYSAAELDRFGGTLLAEVLQMICKGPGTPLIDLRSTEQKLNGWSFAALSGKFACLPFYGMADGSVSYLPEAIYHAYYENSGAQAGFHGFGAGSSKAEAMLEGLCGIAQRYAARQILIEGKTPPALPDTLLQQLPKHIAETVCGITHSGQYRLQLMDASCGIGLPVVAAVLTDCRTGLAAAAFGAHPCFAAALSRCIAAVLAGKTAEQPGAMSVAAWGAGAQDSSYPNRFNLMNGSSGVYPLTLFYDVPSWQYQPWQEVPMDSLTQMEMLLALYDKLGWHVYVRETSAAAIYAIQVLVPQAGILHDFGTIQMQAQRMHTETMYTFRHMAAADGDAQKRAALYAKMKLGYRGENGFDALSGIPYKPTVLGVKLDAVLVYALILLQEQQYGEASALLKPYSVNHTGRISRMDVLLRLLEGVMAGNDRTLLHTSLSAIYPKAWVAEAEQVLSDPLAQLPVLPCCNGIYREDGLICQACAERHKCTMPGTIEVLQRMHEEQRVS